MYDTVEREKNVKICEETFNFIQDLILLKMKLINGFYFTSVCLETCIMSDGSKRLVKNFPRF